MKINILAIESSCDETSASVISNGKILNNIIVSQKVHEKYGGIVPELASRAHHQQIVPVVDDAIKSSGISINNLDAIAFTQGPGLLGSLLVGSSFAKSLALGLNIPLIAVNHMQGHILAHFIESPKPKFPFLCLTVSGGHTQIVKITDYLKMEVLGQTKDDAVGEAFDKCAKFMGMKYPGGPLIDKYSKTGNQNAFQFSKSSMPGLDYSFSGIKTSFLYYIKNQTHTKTNFVKENMEDLSASIQKHLIDMLMEKLVKASEQENIKEIAIAGGVSANLGLRIAVEKEGKNKGWNIYIPKFEYCTDNAAMIAITAHYMYLNQDFATMSVTSMPRMSFNSECRILGV